MRNTERLRVRSDERRAVFVTFVFFLMGIVPDNTKTNDDDLKVFVLAVLASLRWQERPSGRAAVLMTACEKTLVDDIEDVGSGQVANSVLQVGMSGFDLLELLYLCHGNVSNERTEIPAKVHGSDCNQVACPSSRQCLRKREFWMSKSKYKNGILKRNTPNDEQRKAGTARP